MSNGDVIVTAAADLALKLSYSTHCSFTLKKPNTYITHSAITHNLPADQFDLSLGCLLVSEVLLLTYMQAKPEATSDAAQTHKAALGALGSFLNPRGQK